MSQPETPSKPFIVKRWPSAFTAHYGHTLPSTYISYDLEATGFSFTKDLILEIGHTVVKDGEIAQVSSTYLDWTRTEYVGEQWLRDKIDSVKRAIEQDADGNPTGETFAITYEKLRDEGVHPQKALRFYFDLFSAVEDNKGFIVGHNVIRFDSAFIKEAFKEWLGKEFEFGLNTVFDVGAIEKADQTDILPLESSTLHSYLRYVSNIRRKGIKWSVNHCMEKYGVAKECDIRLDEMHSAGMDSMCVALIFERFREMSR